MSYIPLKTHERETMTNEEEEFFKLFGSVPRNDLDLDLLGEGHVLSDADNLDQARGGLVQDNPPSSVESSPNEEIQSTSGDQIRRGTSETAGQGNVEEATSSIGLFGDIPITAVITEVNGPPNGPPNGPIGLMGTPMPITGRGQTELFTASARRLPQGNEDPSASFSKSGVIHQGVTYPATCSEEVRQGLQEKIQQKSGSGDVGCHDNRPKGGGKVTGSIKNTCNSKAKKGQELDEEAKKAKKKEQNCVHARKTRLKDKEKKIEMQNTIRRLKCNQEIFKKIISMLYWQLHGEYPTYRLHTMAWFETSDGNSDPIQVQCLLPSVEQSFLDELGNNPGRGLIKTDHDIMIEEPPQSPKPEVKMSEKKENATETGQPVCPVEPMEKQTEKCKDEQNKSFTVTPKVTMDEPKQDVQQVRSGGNSGPSPMQSSQPPHTEMSVVSAATTNVAVTSTANAPVLASPSMEGHIVYVTLKTGQRIPLRLVKKDDELTPIQNPNFEGSPSKVCRLSQSQNVTMTPSTGASYSMKTSESFPMPKRYPTISNDSVSPPSIDFGKLFRSSFENRILGSNEFVRTDSRSYALNQAGVVVSDSAPSNHFGPITVGQNANRPSHPPALAPGSTRPAKNTSHSAPEHFPDVGGVSNSNTTNPLVSGTNAPFPSTRQMFESAPTVARNVYSAPAPTVPFGQNSSAHVLKPSTSDTQLRPFQSVSGPYGSVSSVHKGQSPFAFETTAVSSSNFGTFPAVFGQSGPSVGLCQSTLFSGQTTSASEYAQMSPLNPGPYHRETLPSSLVDDDSRSMFSSLPQTVLDDLNSMHEDEPLDFLGGILDLDMQELTDEQR